ncbi:hypothetical protein NY2A_B109R [Paramecium bursaria Chlorella virus NY2A]|uniref:Uncharacterized protein B109R n=1 Tax=Paramecium bursaria Chlorella virus NY2A TaxID=46021 RepID=A7IVY4_PBCVN|nr:hypothetical protein NY2A_B109R [Paramecium bursaria Chlorella virus NY2A]YP_001498178.1 hypothetical protein AR158_c096R [Paramecium bursaria Chlorella virus AR158]ABT14508.1 hypothetical protein NY2A_B109R [Paramecium bursaria Chlorella virus NY2A]ABU43642.1 hypothetical protein AR158_c096R [Paramecium bursaria Chlorella virus AR158]
MLRYTRFLMSFGVFDTSRILSVFPMILWISEFGSSLFVIPSGNAITLGCCMFRFWQNHARRFGNRMMSSSRSDIS